MKKSFLLFIIFLIFIFSSSTFYMIINYLDPYINKIISISFIGFTFILSIATFFTLILFFVKKIHYRWRVELFHVKSSFRQWLLISLFAIWIVIFKILDAPIFVLAFLLISILSFLELFIRNLDY
jgi:hypothetical protein